MKKNNHIGIYSFPEARIRYNKLRKKNEHRKKEDIGAAVW